MILVVDDKPANREMLGRGLGAVIEFSAERARSARVLQARRVDLLLLDVMMPPVDGYGCCGSSKPTSIARHPRSDDLRGR